MEGQCVAEVPTGDDDDDDDTTTTGSPPDAPRLETDPAVVSLGDVGVGCLEATTLTVLNTGSEDLYLSAVDTTRGWEVSADLPLTLPPGASDVLALEVAPEAEGPAEGTLTLSSNDPRGDQLVLLTVNGVFDTRTTSHTVPGAVVDVMVLIDHSCSMEEDNQAEVAAAMPLLLTTLTATWDWNLALVTAEDGCMNGSLMTPATPDAASYLVAHAFDSDFSGTYRTEALLQLAGLALSKSDPGECNEGLLRPGAPLLLVLASDEREQSGTAAATWVAGYQTLASPVLVSGAFDLNLNCGDGSGATGYTEAVALTGGTTLDICQGWGSRADELVDGVPVVQSANEVILLEEPAAAEPTEVRVDGVPTSAWTFDATANTIEVTAGLQPGSVVEVDYPVSPACD